MSKGPDLSAFPIPRKGAARPIALEGSLDEPQREGQGANIEQLRPPTPAPVAAPESAQKSAESKKPKNPVMAPLAALPTASAVPSGQMIATTVKLDESRYLRLADAGRPAPGRLKRRTIQEIMVEALDEWFERRGL